MATQSNVRTTRRTALAQLAAVGVLVAATGAAVSPAAGALHSGTTLLAATGPLAGSETAIIVGGTGQPTPSDTFAQSAANLYLNPLGFLGGATDSDVCHMDGTDPCSAPLQVLTTPMLFEQGKSSYDGAALVVEAVKNQFTENPGAFDAEHPLTIFGYSQGATAESIAMTQLHEAGIPLDALHFVFIGNPSAPDGVWQHLEAAMDATFGEDLGDFLLKLLGMTETLGNSTPNDLYDATIYGLPDDPVANFKDVYEADGLWSALGGIVGPHVEYLGLTPDQIANATTVTDGNLNYVNIDNSEIDAFAAWASALFDHGVADSDPFQSVWDSLVFFVENLFNILF